MKGWMSGQTEKITEVLVGPFNTVIALSYSDINIYLKHQLYKLSHGNILMPSLKLPLPLNIIPVIRYSGR